MTTPKQCAAAGTHDGQPWQCERTTARAGSTRPLVKAGNLGMVCMAHFMQWKRERYPEAFVFLPLRVRATSPGVAVAVQVPPAIAEALKTRAKAEGRSVSELCRHALERLAYYDW